MGRYYELAALLGHFVYKEDEGELSLGREGSFRFVDQIEAAGYDTRLEEVQKAFAVRVVVEVFSVSSVDGTFVGLHVASHTRVVFKALNVLIECVFEFAIAADESKEILGSQKEAFAGAT